MPGALSITELDPIVLLLACLLGAAVPGVTWLLAERVQALASTPRWAAAWWTGAGVVLGTGLWVLQLIVLSVPHRGMTVFTGWPAMAGWCVAVLAASLAVAAWRQRSGWTAALAMAVLATGGALGQASARWLSGVLARGGPWPAPDGGPALPHDPAVSLLAMAALLLLGLAAACALIDKRTRARAQLLAQSLQKVNDELQRAVLFDSLTSLPNRRLMFERLNAVTRRCDSEGRQAALLFIDLDGFKPLNDLFGHGFGDAVLCEASHRLLSAAREGDTVARLGGDEFVILLAGLTDSAVAHQVAMRAVSALQAPMKLGRREARVSASIGIAIYPADGASNKLLAAADAAMYEAKRNGGSQAVFFSAHMETDTREQIELQRDLRLAIDNPERGELSLHYQPKISARDGRITGVEALLRWRQPERGMVSPVLFIPVAERFGLIDRLGAWVIDEACRQMRDWEAQGLRMRVAVNLSMHQLRQAGLVDRVRAALNRHELLPSRLMFEITESAAMGDSDATGRVFDELAALGTELSIDDFGTGYSSLAWLRRLPSRQIKIDRSFVKDIDSRNDARAIVEAVIRLAHALGLSVVAEGVETTAQRDLLQQLQCDEYQGYLFARPVPGDTILGWSQGRELPSRILPGGVAWTGVDHAEATQPA